MVALFFVFGALFGSFLNVVAIRYNTGKGLHGRSRCASCGKGLLWFELVPIISFFALRGRCFTCKSALSIQYPLVEGATALIFCGVYLVSSGALEILFSLVLFSLLIVIAVYDIRHAIIPDGLVYAFSGLALIQMWGSPASLSFLVPSSTNMLAGVVVALPLFLLWLLSSGRWIGLGYTKLFLGTGWVLGMSGGGSALILAFWIGAFVSVALLAYESIRHAQRRRGRTPALNSEHKRFTMKSEVPFAPFIILGILLVYFFDINVIELAMFS